MITVAMLSEYEKESVFSFSPAFRGKFFTSLYLLCDEEPDASFALMDRRNPFEEVLFIAPASLARRLHDARPELWILGVQRQNSAATWSLPAQSRLALCSTALSVESLYGKMQNLFLVLSQWIARLREIVIRQGSPQDLLDASEAVLKNFITISDANFKLVASTKNIEIDDPRALELVTLGRHSEQTIALFKRDNIMDQWEKRSRIADTPPIVSKYRTLDYVYRRCGRYYLHLIMHCNNVPLSMGLSDAFRVLVDHIDFIVRQSPSVGEGPSSETASLVADLVLRRPLGDKELERRAERADLPIDGPLSVAAFRLEEGLHAERYVPYYEQTIAEALPAFSVCSYGSFVLALRAGEIGVEEALKFDEVAARCSCMVGISDPIRSLRDIPFAFRQAKEAIAAALEETPSLGQLLLGRPQRASAFFRDAFPSFALRTAAQDDFVAKYASQGVVRRVQIEDKEHGTNDAELLFAYLKNGNNLRRTSEELFLHRSTLSYRIKRLCERFCIDLDDPVVRLGLIVEYFSVKAL